MVEDVPPPSVRLFMPALRGGKLCVPALYEPALRVVDALGRGGMAPFDFHARVASPPK